MAVIHFYFRALDIQKYLRQETLTKIDHQSMTLSYIELTNSQFITRGESAKLKGFKATELLKRVFILLGI